MSLAKLMKDYNAVFFTSPEIRNGKVILGFYRSKEGIQLMVFRNNKVYLIKGEDL